MYKVGIIGPESSGKSTLAKYLAKRYKGTLVPEYAREYVESKVKRQKTKDITWDELCEIARHQIAELEEVSRQRAGICIFDTELIITKVWFDYAFGQVPEWLNEAIRRYPMDVYLLCKPDIPWVQDGARFNGNDDIRQELYERYKREINELGVPYYIIEHEG